jgi:hypothetical protein
MAAHRAPDYEIAKEWLGHTNHTQLGRASNTLQTTTIAHRQLQFSSLTARRIQLGEVARREPCDLRPIQSGEQHEKSQDDFNDLTVCGDN